jgi:hypothetical protein
MPRRTVLVTGLAVALIALIYFVFATTSNSDLRGTWTKSTDGKTYLIIGDDNGWPGSLGPILIDGVAWVYPVGRPGPIQPGRHTIGCCGAEIGFEIRPGVAYTFNYWGP